MTSGFKHLEYRRLRAPQENGGVVVDPPFDRVGELLALNQERRRGYCYDLHGRCLSELAAEARRELVAEARRWTRSYRDSDEDQIEPSVPILLAGHQPQLFHPGVWFKNFALGALADAHGAVAVNLLIDSDTFKTNVLRVPGGSVERPIPRSITMDLPGPPVPFEERQVLDRRRFADFGRCVADCIRPLVPDPLIRDYWPLAVASAERSGNLGAALAQSRHQWEARWGLNTLEVPQSRVCQIRPHLWFVAHLLAQLPRLRQTYNEVVGEYRQMHRIRSRAHPVPDLTAVDEWLEAPFWIWSTDDPRRRPLFVRSQGRQMVLTDRHAVRFTLPLSPDGSAGGAVERLRQLPRDGLKIRCRALITTLWARLALGDLCLHGIGGAKYDQVTDALIARFFGLDPPEFLVLSATLHLPVARPRSSADDARVIRQRLRELTYHPECSVDGAGPWPKDVEADPTELLAAKARWIRTPQTPENARTRYLEIRRINQALQPFVSRERNELLAELRQCAQTMRAEAVLSWREYGFCLYPEKTLRDFLSDLLPKPE